MAGWRTVQRRLPKLLGWLCKRWSWAKTTRSRSPWVGLPSHSRWTRPRMERLTIGGFLLGFFLSIIGWKNLYDKRRFTGTALICCGWLLGALSLALIWWTPL